MDDRRRLETERHQIEQIRELEFEELQIEEIDELNDSSDDELDAIGVDGTAEFTFNTCLASLHSYLGEVEDTHHRMAFLEGGAVLTLPLFYLEGVVLFPEATLPLRVIQPNFIAAVERALTQVDAPYTIGVVRVYRDPHNGQRRFATIGTTAESSEFLTFLNDGLCPIEPRGTVFARPVCPCACNGIRKLRIRQYRRLEDGSLNVVTRGQQRFCLRRRWFELEGMPCGEIQIIEEDLPLRTPRDAFRKLGPVSNLRSHGLSRTLASNTSSRGYGNGDNDSEASSEESFRSELSPTERRIHESAIDSGDRYDVMDESTSSDDDNSGFKSDILSGRSHLNDSDSIGSWKQSENVDFRIGKSSVLGRQSHRGEGSKMLCRRIELGQFRRTSRAFWPYWVYSMYDSYCLARRAADKWKQVVGTPSMDSFVRKPDLLSFYIASKIPVSESTRQELLEIDGVSYRLRREIELLESFDIVQCKTCKTAIARRSDMLVMSSEGPLGAYVNPGGSVHEIMTLYKANSLALRDRAYTEYSWFPGYKLNLSCSVVCCVCI
ncbi:hypothetical protein Pint_12870 [Pistacia integerrima]|uniref:Uncharacterized protein n=1 Tax=Pistacia integerrima TaxID=434235 RepID=A0ACC0YB78_9ROSI|nr:hypothetical protein Pint_12870 [Pistacia integerrima]